MERLVTQWLIEIFTTKKNYKRHCTEQRDGRRSQGGKIICIQDKFVQVRLEDNVYHKTASQGKQRTISLTLWQNRISTNKQREPIGEDEESTIHMTRSERENPVSNTRVRSYQFVTSQLDMVKPLLWLRLRVYSLQVIQDTSHLNLNTLHINYLLRKNAFNQDSL